MQDQLTKEDIPNFDCLRANYRIRREFKNTKVNLSESRPTLIEKLRLAGFA